MDIKKNKLQWFTSFLIKNILEVVLQMKLDKINNLQMNFINQSSGKKRKVYSSFKDNIWGADLADMQLISKYSKEIRYLICTIDLFSKYAWIFPLKDKKVVSIVNAFQKIIDNSKRKPNKIQADQGSEFYNSQFKEVLKENHMEKYSTYNEGKSAVAEKFIKTLKNKIYKHMTAVLKDFDVLDVIVDEYDNTFHKTIKIKPIDIKLDSYSVYNVESNEKDPKFKAGDHVRISKYKNIFAKVYTPNWYEEVFAISKIKNTVSWTYVINDLNDEETIRTF